MPDTTPCVIVLAIKTDRLTEAHDMDTSAILDFDFDLGERTVERLLVQAWREEQLVSLGLPTMLAEVFADRLDWHELAALIGRGCPVMVAFEIVR